LINGQLDTLIRGLREASAGDTKRRLIVTADANASHQAVVQAMDAAGQVGLVRISITTQNPKDDS
jgi:biopolymer transport protein ExbD